MRIAAAALAACLLSSTALAQSTERYAPWQPDTERVEALLDELEGMVAQAERDRAASPDFLADLQRLIEEYAMVAEPPPPPETPAETPPEAPDEPPAAPGRTIFSDEFGDGNFTAAPAWSVAQGSWAVNPDDGLASDARPSAAGQDEVAAIFLEQAIPNAFTVGFDLADRGDAGQIEMRVYQGAAREAGYRLVYRADGAPSFALYRVGRDRVTQIAQTSAPVALPADGGRVGWIRDEAGVMTVTLDGRTILQAPDTNFKERWTGLMLVNFGGDFAIRSIAASSPS